MDFEKELGIRELKNGNTLEIKVPKEWLQKVKSK